LSKFISALHSQSELCPPTPVLSANLVPGETSPLLALTEDGGILPSMLKTLPGGHVVGTVGINIKDKTIQGSNPDEGTTYIDEREAAAAEVAKLKEAGASIIILLTHIGYGNDMEWMVDIDGVDVVVGGDSHTLMGDPNTVGIVIEPHENSYPALYSRGDGRNVCVAQAWEYGRGLGKLQVSFDESGKVTSCDGSMVFPFNGKVFTVKTDPEDYDLTTEDGAEDIAAYLESLGPHLVATPEDEDTATKLAEYSSQTDELKTQIIATVPENICYDRIPGQGRSEICPSEETAAQGGGACNIVAKAFLDQVKSADMAIQNGGGCRSDIKAGDFSIDNAITLLPFGNTLVTLEMTGSEIIEVLEQALDFALNTDGSTGAYPYASGIRFDVDATKPMGERFSSVEVNPRGEGDWTDLVSDETYVVATNSFISEGKDGYVLFGDISGQEGKLVNTYLEYAQTFIDYCETIGTLLHIPLEEYSTQSFIPAPTDSA